MNELKKYLNAKLISLFYVDHTLYRSIMENISYCLEIVCKFKREKEETVAY